MKNIIKKPGIIDTKNVLESSKYKELFTVINDYLGKGVVLQTEGDSNIPIRYNTSTNNLEKFSGGVWSVVSATTTATTSIQRLTDLDVNLIANSPLSQSTGTDYVTLDLLYDATNLTLSGSDLTTIQPINVNASPTFDSLTLTNNLKVNSYTGILTAINGDVGYIPTAPTSTFLRGDHSFQPVVSDYVLMHVLGTAAGSSLQNWANSTQWAGRISGGTISLSATYPYISVTSGQGFLKASSDVNSELRFIDWSSSILQCATDVLVYVVVAYDTGTPVLSTTTNRDAIEGKTVFPLGRVFFHNNHGHIIDSAIEANLLGYTTHNRAIELRGVERASGALISSPAGLKVASTSGVFYIGNKRLTTSSRNTNVSDTFTYYYRDGSNGWTPVLSQTDIDNTYYDDGTGTLAELNSNQYGIHWVYIQNDGDIVIVYGQDSYKLAEAEIALPPANTPGCVQYFSSLAAKIVVQKGASTPNAILSTYINQYPWSAVPNHNDLSNIQGGIANQYYHLSFAEAVSLSSSAFVPYTGARTNVNLGANSLTAGQVNIDNYGAGVDVTEITPTAGGIILYNSQTGTSYANLIAGDIKSNTIPSSCVVFTNSDNGIMSGSTDFTYAPGLLTTPNISARVVSASSMVSTVTTGQPPMIVNSTTKVSNLNVDQVDGYDISTAVNQVAYNSGGDLVGSDEFTWLGTGGLVIKRSGNVIREDGSSSNFNLINYRDSASLGGIFNFQQARGTSTSPTTSQNNDLMMTLAAYGTDIGNAFKASLLIRGYVDDNITSTFVPGRMFFGARATNGTFYNLVGLYSDQTVRIGANTATTSSIPTNCTEFENSGFAHLYGSAQAWEDLLISADSARLGSGTKAPSWTAFVNNTQALVFDDAVVANEKEIYASTQMPHAWLVNDTIYLHIHYTPSTTPVASANAVMKLDYCMAGIDGTFSTSGTLTFNLSIPTSASTTTHYISTDTAIGSLTGQTISSILKMRLYRNSSTASDTYTGDILFHFIDTHYRKDTHGSRTRLTK